jgi:hypothetical protein
MCMLRGLRAASCFYHSVSSTVFIHRRSFVVAVRPYLAKSRKVSYAVYVINQFGYKLILLPTIEELRDLYSSPSIIKIIKARRMRWTGHVAWMGEKRNAYRSLVGKPEGWRPLGRPRRRWLDTIRMDLVEVGWDDVDWIGLSQERDRWRALVPSGSMKCLETIEYPNN